MLGQHKLLERHLRKSGKSAIATVLEAKQTHWAVGSGNPNLVANNNIVWKLKLRVAPDGEPAFEAATDEAFGQLECPSEGNKFPVLYDPSDHKKVMIDNSEAAQAGLLEQGINDRLQGQIDRARERGSERVADGLAQLKASGLLANYDYKNPAKATEQREQIKKMMLDAQAAHGLPASNLIVGGQPVFGGQQGAPSTADELTKLAALRDRGVLTDAEFEAQKKKLLGE
jgi:Short C-terminal domain